MSSFHSLLHRKPEFPFARPGLESLVNQLNKIHSQPLIKSENNNILSSLTKMTEVQPAASPLYQSEPGSVTPPVSPPHSSPDTSFTRIAPNSSFVLNNNPVSEESEDSNETGLDLTVKKEPKSDENEVSTTANTPCVPEPEPVDPFKDRKSVV